MQTARALAGCYFGMGEGSVAIGVGPSPDIVSQPQSVAVFVGDTASFGVSVVSISSVVYQWRRNGAPIAGANDAVFRATSVSLNDNGALFSVRVCNDFGCTTSGNAALTVTPR
jgi:beta-galactosidase